MITFYSLPIIFGGNPKVHVSSKAHRIRFKTGEDYLKFSSEFHFTQNKKSRPKLDKFLCEKRSDTTKEFHEN